MLVFEQKGIVFTGYEERVSERGNKYLIVNFLDNTGRTFSSMLMPDCFDNLANLNQLDRVNVTFGLVPGRYMKLNVLHITK